MSPVKSRVVPDGTAILFRTMVAQEVFDLVAAAASVKVQAVRFPKLGAGVCYVL